MRFQQWLSATINCLNCRLLIDKEMTNVELAEKAGFSAKIITRLKRNGYVSLESIEKYAMYSNCRVDEILEFTKENGNTRRL